MRKKEKMQKYVNGYNVEQQPWMNIELVWWKNVCKLKQYLFLQFLSSKQTGKHLTNQLLAKRKRAKVQADEKLKLITIKK